MLDFFKNILLILGGIIGCFIFVKIHEVLKKQANNKSEEKFLISKFAAGMLDVFSPVGWAKDIYSLLNLRKLIVYTIIIISIFGYGLYRGKINKPVQFNLNYEAEMTIPVPNEAKAFYKPKNSSEAYWLMEDGSKKVIIVKDIPELRKALKPFGLDIRPFVTAGGSLGQTGAKAEAGIGLQYFKWYIVYLNAFLTNVGLYPAGVSYRITDNFDILGGYGYGYKGDQRFFLGGKWRF